MTVVQQPWSSRDGPTSCQQVFHLGAKSEPPGTRALSRRPRKALWWLWEGHRASIPHSWLSPPQSIQHKYIQEAPDSQAPEDVAGEGTGSDLPCSVSPGTPLSPWAGPGLPPKGPLTITMLGSWHPAPVGSRGSSLCGESSPRHSPSRAVCHAVLASHKSHCSQRKPPWQQSPSGPRDGHQPRGAGVTAPLLPGLQVRSSGTEGRAWSRARELSPGPPTKNHSALPAHQQWTSGGSSFSAVLV